MSKRQSLDQKSAFILGLVAGVGLFFALGFLFLLKSALGGGSISWGWMNRFEKAPAEWTRGSEKAAVTIVEYSDLECPFCKRFHTTMQQVMAEYDGRVKWVYRHFPLTQLHPKAVKEAEAAECAGELGGNEAFWKYIDRIYEITPANNGLDLAELPKIAEGIGLKKDKFEECLNSGRHAAKVQAQADQAVADGAQGTPYSLIIAGDKRTPVGGAVPIESLRGMIDQAMQ